MYLKHNINYLILVIVGLFLAYLQKQAPSDGKVILAVLASTFIFLGIFKLIYPNKYLFWLSKSGENLLIGCLVYVPLIIFTVLWSLSGS